MAKSVAPTKSAAASVYQFRVVVAGVSPLIWRRLLVPTTTTIADLHGVLQAAFGWSGQHLHRFAIHGREYGIGYVGGPGFRDDAHRVALTDLGLRATERFAYHYDFTDDWRLDLRVGRSYPRSPAGAAPGRWRAAAGRGRSSSRPSPTGGMRPRSARPRSSVSSSTTSSPRSGVDREELAGLLPLLGLERFDRRALNRTLAGLTTTDRSVT